MTLRKIVVLTDFSPCSRLAYAPAAEWARRFGATIQLAHAFPSQFEGARVQVEDKPGAVIEYRDALEERLEKEAGNDLFRGCSPRAVLLSGRGPDAVGDFVEKEKADLLVQSSHGRSGWRRAFLGSFAEGIVRRSSAPVLTFRGEREEAREFVPRRILYPHDFSDAARLPLEAVRFLARTFESEVLVFHVIHALPPIPGPVGAEPVPIHAAEPAGLRERLLGDLKTFAAAELGGIPHDVDVARGDPGSEILERSLAWRADLIAMATHGHAGLERLFLGSTAEKVVRLAPCPVLTLRSPTTSR